jgi:hypothetical protein
MVLPLSISRITFTGLMLQTFSTEKESVRTKNFIVQSNIPYSYTKVTDFKE